MIRSQCVLLVIITTCCCSTQFGMFRQTIFTFGDTGKSVHLPFACHSSSKGNSKNEVRALSPCTPSWVASV
ncbi:hypothetical protein PF005_g13016 [Phytophthora fragariae]|uniref:Secreted protein n=2 Tax=Phytophthora TaxID=4783 RepID=A0A6A3GVD0_9STRA|nr:hypothetical protein PF003_g26889 [Phytophthora fragariae]KAE8959584.1 hypothetical protein PR002_g30494 [Phytophthora rubi]KAE8944361.1 hypothetical protein PF009_g5957 [Phytophthora fragariae]KAE8959672.1 hypothetical protein PR001_g30640 [Phytophthora rubi]KAE8960971.1 hypothetical protein PF011_g29918 [Phytophthora fragariae]